MAVMGPVGGNNLAGVMLAIRQQAEMEKQRQAERRQQLAATVMGGVNTFSNLANTANAWTQPFLQRDFQGEQNQQFRDLQSMMHTTPSGSAVLGAETSKYLHGTPSGSALLGAETSKYLHDKPSGSAVLADTGATKRLETSLGAESKERALDRSVRREEYAGVPGSVAADIASRENLYGKPSGNLIAQLAFQREARATPSADTLAEIDANERAQARNRQYQEELWNLRMPGMLQIETSRHPDVSVSINDALQEHMAKIGMNDRLTLGEMGFPSTGSSAMGPNPTVQAMEYLSADPVFRSSIGRPVMTEKAPALTAEDLNIAIQSPKTGVPMLEGIYKLPWPQQRALILSAAEALRSRTGGKDPFADIVGKWKFTNPGRLPRATLPGSFDETPGAAPFTPKSTPIDAVDYPMPGLPEDEVKAMRVLHRMRQIFENAKDSKTDKPLGVYLP